MVQFISAHLGEFSALLTAFCWAGSSLLFEKAGKSSNSFTVNIVRLLFALLFLSLFCLVVYHEVLPFKAALHSWIWLSISGLIGFTLGDLFLFEAFIMIGARISMLMMALAPPIAAFIGFFMFHDTLTLKSMIGMVLTLTGITIVVLERNHNHSEIKGRKLFIGVLFAFFGAFGQGLGLNLSKFGIQDLNPFSATQIRVIAGIIGFAITFSIMRVWPKVFQGLKNKNGAAFSSLGAFFGPFLGVSFSLLAVKHANIGIASTIMALPPVLIIPFAVLFMKEEITVKEVFASILAISGTAVFFL